MDVLLVAVKKDKISDYTSVISQAGKTPAMVDVDVFALQNCYEVNYGVDPGRVIALLNVGASIMNINIVKGAHLDLQPRHRGGRQPVHRRHPEGPEPLLRPGRGAEEAARAWRAAPGEPAPRSCRRSPRTSRSRSRRPSTSSRPRAPRTASTASSSPAGPPRCTACRSCSSDRFEAGVELMNPFNNVTYNPRDFDPDFINEIGPRPPSPWGWPCERWATDDPRSTSSPPIGRRKKKKARGPRPAPSRPTCSWPSSPAAPSCVCAGLWYLSVEPDQRPRREIAAAEQRQRELQAIKVQVDALEAKRATFQRKVDLIERLKAEQSGPVHMLDEISKSLPDFVWLIPSTRPATASSSRARATA